MPDKKTRISLNELCKREGQSMEEICIECESDCQAPALCSEGCYTELDGECIHGNPSILRACGMI